MAKSIFQIKPKLPDEAKAALPVQDFSPEKILEIVRQSQPPTEQGGEAAPEKTTHPKTRRKPAEQMKPPVKKSARKPAKRSLEPDPNKRPQGRPPREAPVKRISSDLPAELYDRVQTEIRAQGYTLNGFLAKVLREYFSR